MQSSSPLPLLGYRAVNIPRSAPDESTVKYRNNPPPFLCSKVYSITNRTFIRGSHTDTNTTPVASLTPAVVAQISYCELDTIEIVSAAKPAFDRRFSAECEGKHRSEVLITNQGTVAVGASHVHSTVQTDAPGVAETCRGPAAVARVRLGGDPRALAVSGVDAGTANRTGFGSHEVGPLVVADPRPLPPEVAPYPAWAATSTTLAVFMRDARRVL